MRGVEASFGNQDPSKLPTGLTKREYFAVMMLQGLVSGYESGQKSNGFYIPESVYPDLAAEAVQLADELLKALES